MCIYLEGDPLADLVAILSPQRGLYENPYSAPVEEWAVPSPQRLLTSKGAKISYLQEKEVLVDDPWNTEWVMILREPRHAIRSLRYR